MDKESHFLRRIAATEFSRGVSTHGTVGEYFLVASATAEFSRGFQPTRRLENISSSRQRRLNSIVADATGNENHAHRAMTINPRLNSVAAMRRGDASHSQSKMRQPDIQHGASPLLPDRVQGFGQSGIQLIGTANDSREGSAGRGGDS